MKNKPRIVFYSHDTMGLGHIRRNMLLTQSILQANPNTEVLLLSGVRESGVFRLPEGADSVTMPTYYKTVEGEYIPRSLGTDIKRLVNIRTQIIRGALEAFDPDIFIIDNVPRGAMNELDSILPVVAAKGTHIVLGLRDIIDEPEVVHRQWAKLKNAEVIRLYFSSLWVYGDPKLFDFVKEYHLDEDAAGKLHYLGYLDQTCRTESHGLDSAMCEIQAPYVLCVVGGGQDGFKLSETFMKAELPPGLQGVLITGTFMPQSQRAELHEKAKQRADIRVIDFVSDPLKLMKQAECVIAMGGYNTVTEILSFNKQALIVPRIRPRREQWIRASRLAQLGAVRCLHPDHLTAQTLSGWLSEQKSHSDIRDILRFNGLANAVIQINGILNNLKNSR